jgi:hypothetical protein
VQDDLRGCGYERGHDEGLLRATRATGNRTLVRAESQGEGALRAAAPARNHTPMRRLPAMTLPGFADARRVWREARSFSCDHHAWPLHAIHPLSSADAHAHSGTACDDLHRRECADDTAAETAWDAANLAAIRRAWARSPFRPSSPCSRLRRGIMSVELCILRQDCVKYYSRKHDRVCIGVVRLIRSSSCRLLTMYPVSQRSPTEKMHIQDLVGTYDWVWCSNFGCQYKPEGALVLAPPANGQPGIAGTASYDGWAPAQISLDGAARGTQWALRLASPEGTEPPYAPEDAGHSLFVSAVRDDAGAPFLEMHFNCGWSGCTQWFMYVVGKRRAPDESLARISEAEKRRLGIGLYTREDHPDYEDMPQDAEFLEDQDVGEESSDGEDEDYPEAADGDDKPSARDTLVAASTDHAPAASVFSRASKNGIPELLAPEDSSVAEHVIAGDASHVKFQASDDTRGTSCDIAAAASLLPTSEHSLTLNRPTKGCHTALKRKAEDYGNGQTRLRVKRLVT